MANHTSLIPHPDYPALPQQAVVVQPDAGCVGCPLAQAEGHKSCDQFKLTNNPPVPDSARLNLTAMRSQQGRVHRRAFDSDGIIGSNNGAGADPWYFYSAGKAINFAWSSPWNVTDVSGNLVTLQTDGDDARRVLLSTWREKDPVIGLYWVGGFASYTCVQALDMLEFQWPSRAAFLKSKILQITSATPTQIVVRLDKDLSSIWDSFFPVSDGAGGFLDDPEVVTAKVYHYGRESEAWYYLQEPHYFLGKRQQRTINAADLPGDGIWVLEQKLICPPESFDPLVPNFVMEGWDGEKWVVINEDRDRLHIKPGLSSYAVRTTLPSGSVANELSSDLATQYSQFRATYYVETSERNSQCRIVGYDRCFHSRIDYSQSVGNFGTTLGAGIAADGRHVYCSQRVYEEYEYNDTVNKSTTPPTPGQDGIPDSVTTTLHHPTGLSLFPTSTGKCVLYNYCNKFVNSVSLNPPADYDDRRPPPSVREAPFNIDRSMRYLVELWFAGDKRLHQLYVLAQGSGGYVTERIMHPSILWLVDYYGGMISPHGFNEKDYPRGNGTWSVVKPITFTDPNGNQELRSVSGLEKGFVAEYDYVNNKAFSDPNRRGVLPANVPGFTTMRDPFTPASIITRDLLEYIGGQIERDSMQLKSTRGLHQISMALGAEDILVPNLDFTSDSLQQRSRSTFKREENGDGTIEILPYRQEGKTEFVIGSRVAVVMQEDLGGGKWKLTFGNETKTFSRFDIGSEEIGDSYNKIFTVQAGGGPAILPYENQALNSHDGDKETGSRAAGVMPLDCLEVDGYRCVVESVEPHGGAEAATWGSRQLVAQGATGGFWEPVVATGDTGEQLTPLDIISVTRMEDSAAVPVNVDPQRPAPEAGKAWFDGNNRLYFSSADATKQFKIDFKDSAGTSYTDYFIPLAEFTVSATDTEAIDYSEWSAATTKQIFLGGVAAEVTEGGTTAPAAGHVRVNDNNGKIQYTFSIDDAPKPWRMVLTFAENAPAPQDDWAVGGNYTSFGKKQDIAIVRADINGGQTKFSTSSVIGSPATFYGNAVVFLPKENFVVMWCEQGVDNWQQVPAQYLHVEAARGKVVVLAAWFAATIPAPVEGQPVKKYCFKVMGIQMVDNRGQVPASLLNKTDAVLDSMNWVITWPGSGFGEFHIDKGYFKSYWEESIGKDAEGNCVTNPAGESAISEGGASVAANGFYFDSVADAGSQVGLHVEGSAFGAPNEIMDWPDGIQIEEAWGVVSGGGLTSDYIYSEAATYDCDGNMTDPGVNTDFESDPSLSNVSCSVLAFKTIDGSEYDVLPISVAGVTTSKVINITELVKAMYANRKKYVGYSLIYSPYGIDPDSSLDLSSMLQRPGVRQATLCAPTDCQEAGDKYDEQFTYTYATIRWDHVSLGRMAIKINYNGHDKLGTLQPRLPAFIDL